MSSTNRWGTRVPSVSCAVCAIWLCPHKLIGFLGMQREQYFRCRWWVIGKQCSQTVSDQSSEEKKLLCCKPVASVWAAGQTAGCRAAADNATTFCCVISGRRLFYQWARRQKMELPKSAKRDWRRRSFSLFFRIFLREFHWDARPVAELGADHTKTAEAWLHYRNVQKYSQENQRFFFTLFPVITIQQIKETMKMTIFGALSLKRFAYV